MQKKWEVKWKIERGCPRVQRDNPPALARGLTIVPELQIRGSTEDNSKIIFLISQ